MYSEKKCCGTYWCPSRQHFSGAGWCLFPCASKPPSFQYQRSHPILASLTVTLPVAFSNDNTTLYNALTNLNIKYLGIRMLFCWLNISIQCYYLTKTCSKLVQTKLCAAGCWSFCLGDHRRYVLKTTHPILLQYWSISSSLCWLMTALQSTAPTSLSSLWMMQLWWVYLAAEFSPTTEGRQVAW